MDVRWDKPASNKPSVLILLLTNKAQHLFLLSHVPNESPLQHKTVHFRFVLSSSTTFIRSKAFKKTMNSQKKKRQSTDKNPMIFLLQDRKVYGAINRRVT